MEVLFSALMSWGKCLSTISLFILIVDEKNSTKRIIVHCLSTIFEDNSDLQKFYTQRRVQNRQQYSEHPSSEMDSSRILRALGPSLLIKSQEYQGGIGAK